LVLPFCNIEAMNLHLAEISQAVAADAHAVLLVDQAGWHSSDKLVLPANIDRALAVQVARAQPDRKHLAVHARQLALQSRLRVLRRHRRSLLRAWNKLVDQPWRIMSIGLRDWAHGF